MLRVCLDASVLCVLTTALCVDTVLNSPRLHGNKIAFPEVHMPSHHSSLFAVPCSENL
jgi:hypothetical protein